MSVYVKDLWSEAEKKLIYDGIYPNPEYARQLRYKIREKIRHYTEQIRDALLCSEIKDDTLLLRILDLTADVLEAYGYAEDSERVRAMRSEIYSEISKAVIRV